MKHVTPSSLFLKTCLLGVFALVLSQSAQAQARYRNNFRTGVGFAYIVEGDNSGAIFSQQFTRELSDRLNFSASGEYLSSSRYNNANNIFTSRKSFVMFDAGLFFDLTEHAKYSIKIGGGPAFRRRSEVDLVGGPGTSIDNFVHNRKKDVGGKVMLENDFYHDNRLFFGGRAAGYFYNEGTNIFALSLNMGYSF